MPTYFALPKMPGNANKWLRVNSTATGYIWDVTPPPPGGAYAIVESDGTPEIQRQILNFSLLFTISDNVGNLSTDVDIDVVALATDTTFVDNIISNTYFTTNLAGDTNFNDTLISNTYFTTNLAGDNNFTTVLGGDTNFINTLTNNSTFITNVGAVGTSISATDTTPSYLGNKIVAGQNIAFTIENPGGNEDILIDAGPLLQTDGSDNGDQTTLNLVAGTGVTLTDDGMGSVTIDTSASGSGEVVEKTFNQVAHGLTQNQVVRMDASNVFVLSQADIPADAEVTGIVSNVIDVDNFTIATEGFVTVTALPGGAVDGDILFLDNAVPGGLTLTEPTGGTTVSKPVAEVIDAGAKLIYWHNYRGQNNQTIPAGSDIVVKYSTDFATIARYQFVSTGTSAATLTTAGIKLSNNNSGGGDSAKTIGWQSSGIGGLAKVFNNSPLATAVFSLDVLDTAGEFFAVIGGLPFSGGVGFAFTFEHIGFKVIQVAGVATLYATQADGITETASSALTTLVATDQIEVIIQVNGSSSVDYYWRKNGGTLSSAINLATNMPTVTNVVFGMQAGVSTIAGGASHSEYTLANMSYQR